MMVVVERTEALMPHDVESKSLRDPLYRKVAKLLQFKSIHNYSLFTLHFSLASRREAPKYSSVLVYSPVWAE